MAVFEDYNEFDEYLETRFIPTYVLLKKAKNSNGELEYFPSIRLQHIMALRLSDAELEHLMGYLKEKNIRVGGKSATLDGEFENYDYVTAYRKSVLPLSVPTSVTLQKIVMYKQNNDQKLREEIIADNMRLVPYVAYRYAIFTGINQHELESYGYEGLMLALEKFDVNYGGAFSTYAVANIRGQILKGIQEILYGKRDNFYFDYINAKTTVENECGITLDEAPELIEDILDLLVATGKINDDDESKEYARTRITSLAIGNANLNDEEVVEELITSGQLVDTHDYAEEVLNTISRDVLEKRLETLSDREAEVVRLRFGFYDGKAKTLDEVAKLLGLWRNSVYRIEKRALRHLRHQNKLEELEDFCDSETEKYGR